jgi:hypothetical protein
MVLYEKLTRKDLFIMKSYLNHLANKVVDTIFECSENGDFSISEIVINSCESIKKQIDVIKLHREEFFTELWDIAENSDISENESEYLSAVEGAIVMMCGGKI